MTDQGTITLVQRYDRKNTEPLSCGYDAMVAATDMNITLEDFKGICNELNNFSELALTTVASQLGLNLAVLENGFLTVCKNRPHDDYYGLIVHSSYFDGNKQNGHYYTATGKLAKDHELLLVANDY